MTTSMLAFGKANASGSLKLATKNANRLNSTAPIPAPAPAQAKVNHAQPKPVADPAVQRELFLNVLNANATKRDAKQYLSRFRPPQRPGPNPTVVLAQEERNTRNQRDQDRLDRIGVNLGELYAPARAIAESPKFSQQVVNEKTATTTEHKMHVALVCLRDPQALDDVTLDGVALTLSQLVKLDMRILVVLDCSDSSQDILTAESAATNSNETRKSFSEQVERLGKTIAKHSPESARMVTGAIEVSDRDSWNSRETGSHRVASVGLPRLLLSPLKSSIISIIPTTAYTHAGQLIRLSASDIMSALTVMLSGLGPNHVGLLKDGSSAETSLDRIIVLDSAGGIPSKARGGEAHVFVNVEQEFNDIQKELAEYSGEVPEVEQRQAILKTYEQHRSNLSMVRDCLAVLPSSSSALIITPQEAAISSQIEDPDETGTGTGTRRQKNTLIHNLLTNKPMVSSSLPTARLQSVCDTDSETAAIAMPRSTLVKRGMPLSIIPTADSNLGWQVPESGHTPLSIQNDPRVDLPRLVHLINDSFRRKLHVRHYLNRVQNRIAGLIVAGEYEGGAILTWEMPPGTNDPARLVPYLDKFAVLSSSQGSSGVADIVFQAMVQTCFPQGVCWRSRKDNPVNKWYFERADGTWQIPGTNWTMFWTGKGVVEGEERWRDYVGVCTSVQPSWADGKKVVD